MRKEADAKAYELIALARAEAESEIIKSDAVQALAERAKQRFIHEQIQKQSNLEQIASIAEENLSNEVSDIAVDADWRTRFFNKAQDITSTDLQQIWGKILANEIGKPGQYSLRTLDILSNLSKKEAECFNRFSSLCNDNGELIKFNTDFTKYGLKHSDIMRLREAGLVDTSDSLEIIILTGMIKTDIERPSIEMKFKRRGLIIHKQNVSSISFEVYAMTTSGVELHKTIYNPLNDMFFEDLKSYLTKREYFITETSYFDVL